MMKIIIKSSGILLIFLCVNSVFAQEVVNLSTTIKGNQEHPSVSYIVPWQQAADEEKIIMSFSPRTRLNDVFNHVERIEHQRQIEFLTQIQKNKTAN